MDIANKIVVCYNEASLVNRLQEMSHMTEEGFLIWFGIFILLVVIVAVLVVVASVSGAVAGIVDEEDDEDSL